MASKVRIEEPGEQSLMEVPLLEVKATHAGHVNISDHAVAQTFHVPFDEFFRQWRAAPT